MYQMNAGFSKCVNYILYDCSLPQILKIMYLIISARSKNQYLTRCACQQAFCEWQGVRQYQNNLWFVYRITRVIPVKFTNYSQPDKGANFCLSKSQSFIVQRFIVLPITLTKTAPNSAQKLCLCVQHTNFLFPCTALIDWKELQRKQIRKVNKLG